MRIRTEYQHLVLHPSNKISMKGSEMAGVTETWTMFPYANPTLDMDIAEAQHAYLTLVK